MVKKNSTKFITEEQIELCKQYINQCTEPTKCIRKKLTSYQWKHGCEDWLIKQDNPYYIPESALIQAAINLGVPTCWSGIGDSVHLAIIPKEGVKWTRQ